MQSYGSIPNLWIVARATKHYVVNLVSFQDESNLSIGFPEPARKKLLESGSLQK